MIFAAWGAAARQRGAAGGALVAIDGRITGESETSLGHAGPGHDLHVRVSPEGIDAERPGFSHAFFVAPLASASGIASSSLRELVACHPQPRANLDELARFVAGECLAASLNTVYRDVVRVRGVRRLRVRADRVNESPAALAAAPSPEPPAEPKALLDAFRDELGSAVSRASAGHRVVGLPLSGGLDSSGLLVTLRDVGKEIRAFTIDFAAEPDDRPHVAAMERFTGEPVHRMAPEELGAHLTDVVESLTQPTSLPNTSLELGAAARAKALGCDMWMTGVGGDDTFSGDLTAYAATLGSRPVSTLSAVLRMNVPWADTPRVRLQHWLAEPWLPAPLARLMAYRRARIHRRPFPFAGPRLARVLATNDDGPLEDRPARMSPRDRLRATLEHGGSTEAEEARAEIEAFTGFRRADPWFDGRLLAFLSRVPVEVMQVDGLHRGLYRRAFAGRMPESVRLRRDKGAADPFIARAVVAAGGMRFFAPYLDVTACADAGLVEPRAFHPWVAQVSAAPNFFETRLSWIFWRVMVTEAFLRRISW